MPSLALDSTVLRPDSNSPFLIQASSLLSFLFLLFASPSFSSVPVNFFSIIIPPLSFVSRLLCRLVFLSFPPSFLPLHLPLHHFTYPLSSIAYHPFPFHHLSNILTVPVCLSRLYLRRIRVFYHLASPWSPLTLLFRLVSSSPFSASFFVSLSYTVSLSVSLCIPPRCNEADSSRFNDAANFFPLFPVFSTVFCLYISFGLSFFDCPYLGFRLSVGLQSVYLSPTLSHSAFPFNSLLLCPY